MNGFTTRLISALVGVGVLLGLWHFLGLLGLKIVVVFSFIVGSFEIVEILFKKASAPAAKVIFFIFNSLIFSSAVLYPDHAGVFFSFFSTFFFLMSLLLREQFSDLATLTHYQSKSVLGFLYIGLLPAFAIKILDLPRGGLWFVFLLAVVFAGDIGAYLTGMALGRNKLMPDISPKKTIEGSLGGLLCSIVVGWLYSNWFGASTAAFCLLALLTGIVAQFGDLFESQLKRTAEVKDSGRIMPGHGGVLDRIDGVLFACPVILAGAFFMGKSGLF